MISAVIFVIKKVVCTTAVRSKLRLYAWKRLTLVAALPPMVVVGLGPALAGSDGC